MGSAFGAALAGNPSQFAQGDDRRAIRPTRLAVDQYLKTLRGQQQAVVKIIEAAKGSGTRVIKAKKDAAPK